MSQAAKAQEPSMEEILASIRRIIADEDSAKAPTAGPPHPASASTPAATGSPVRPVAVPTSPVPAGPDAASVLPGPELPPAADNPNKDNVLELTESMVEPPQVTPAFQTIDGQPDVVFTDQPVAAEPKVMDEPRRPPAAPPPPPPVSSQPGLQPGLLSARTTEAVNSAFNSLAQTVLVQNARTLEDLVREMLRPMLKSWLDDNLPSMVERIVRAEIERVSRGGG
jgi:cell pole-organizing protein PopZ